MPFLDSGKAVQRLFSTVTKAAPAGLYERGRVPSVQGKASAMFQAGPSFGAPGQRDPARRKLDRAEEAGQLRLTGFKQPPFTSATARDPISRSSTTSFFWATSLGWRRGELARTRRRSPRKQLNKDRKDDQHQCGSQQNSTDDDQRER